MRSHLQKNSEAVVTEREDHWPPRFEMGEGEAGCGRRGGAEGGL